MVKFKRLNVNVRFRPAFQPRTMIIDGINYVWGSRDWREEDAAKLRPAETYILLVSAQLPPQNCVVTCQVMTYTGAGAQQVGVGPL